MKSNLNQFINSLTYLDILYLEKQIGISGERQSVVTVIKSHYEGENYHKQFHYQDYDIHRKHISRFKFFSEKLFEESSWDLIRNKFDFFAKRLINRAVINKNNKLVNEILGILENDKSNCNKINLFCLHNTIVVKFTLKSLILQLQHNNDYENLSRAFKLLEFYKPYFIHQEDCFIASTSLKQKYQNKEWEKLEEDIDQLHTMLQNQYLSIINKINISTYLTPYYVIKKMNSEHKLMMQNLLNELALNPYRNIRLNNLANKLFFNDFVYLNDVKNAVRFYHDLKRSPSHLDISNYIFHLEIALNLYDLDQARAYMPEHNPINLPQIDKFVLPYIARYYLLANKTEFARFYIVRALNKLRKIESIIYFVQTYSCYFFLLYKERDFSTIVNTYENISFRKSHAKSQKSGEYNFEIRFFYLLASFEVDNISHESCCNKISKLINPESDKIDLFIRLKMKKNLDYLVYLGFKLDARLTRYHGLLKEQVKSLEDINKH